MWNRQYLFLYIDHAWIHLVTNQLSFYVSEYENLDQTLNEIDTWMNKIEEQNDSLNSQLDDLLKSSQEARRELQEENMKEQSKSDGFDTVYLHLVQIFEVNTLQ